jgi:hypothetical protein
MKKSEKIITAILTMVVGIFLVIMQDAFVGILMTVAGVCLLGLGVVDIVNRLVPPAVVKITVGVFIILCGWILVEAILYVLSAILLIFGILLLYDKIKKRCRCDTILETVLEYAIPSGIILIGALLLMHQAIAVEIILIICGVLAVIEGGAVLIQTFNEE